MVDAVAVGRVTADAVGSEDYVAPIVKARGEYVLIIYFQSCVRSCDNGGQAYVRQILRTRFTTKHLTRGVMSVIRFVSSGSRPACSRRPDRKQFGRPVGTFQLMQSST